MDIIMFGFNDWREWENDGFRTRSAIIAKKLSEHDSIDKIIIISRARSLWINIWRILKYGLGGAKHHGTSLCLFSVTQASDKIFLLDQTRVFPREERYPSLYRINGILHDALLRKKIKNLARELDMRDPILWISNPLMGKHIGKLDERVSVFDAIDDWSAHPQKKRMSKTIRQSYKYIADNATIIVAVSKKLVSAFSQKRGDVYWIPNGVEIENFSQTTEVPTDLEGLTRPIIGYVGLLQERIDTALLKTLSENLSNVSIVLIGPVLVEEHFSSLRSIENVHFLGLKPKSLMPSYINAFDICILPHIANDFTASMNPLKLYEYMASGKPTVVTGVSDLEDFEGAIYNTTTVDGFISAVQQLISKPDQMSLKRRQLVQKFSWNNRMAELLGILDTYNRRLTGEVELETDACILG